MPVYESHSTFLFIVFFFHHVVALVAAGIGVIPNIAQFYGEPRLTFYFLIFSPWNAISFCVFVPCSLIRDALRSIRHDCKRRKLLWGKLFKAFLKLKQNAYYVYRENYTVLCMLFQQRKSYLLPMCCHEEKRRRCISCKPHVILYELFSTHVYHQ